MAPSLGSAGSGYVVVPESGHGPGVLVLHAWWGLTPFFHQVCDRLADAGFVALAPDLHGDGRTADTPDEAEALLAPTDPNRTAQLVVSSLSALRSMPATPDGRVGVLGFSMGAPWALWAAAASPTMWPQHRCSTGARTSTSPAACRVQGHFAEYDEFEPDDNIAYLEAQLGLCGHEVEFHRYPGTGHWFVESDRPAAYVEAAATLAWDRTVDFLHRHLDPETDRPEARPADDGDRTERR
ncbi:MAG: dienelactone hydrolase family protein [Acidimicrobiales bacterium]